MPRPRRIYLGYRCPRCRARLHASRTGGYILCLRWGCHYSADLPMGADR